MVRNPRRHFDATGGGARAADLRLLREEVRRVEKKWHKTKRVSRPTNRAILSLLACSVQHFVQIAGQPSTTAARVCCIELLRKRCTATMDDRLKPAAIYIQGLPTSIGNIQVEDICKKAGKIKKIKVYRDAGGVPKGDALVVFEAKRDRDVAADAVAMLDDMDVDQGGLGCYTISVSEAQFSQPRRAPKPKEEAPRSQRELAAAAAKAWGKELPPTDVVQAGDYSAPADCPKALISNVFDSTKTTERDASIETEFGRECQRFGRVLDAECVLRGPDAGALLISFTAVDAARKCCVAMHGRTFDGRGLRCELWPTGARPARRDPSPSPSVSSRRVDPSPSPAREVEVVSAPPRPSSEGRSGAAFSVQELAYIDRVAKAAPRPPAETQERGRRAGVGPPAQAQERGRRAGVGPPAEAPQRQRRGFSADATGGAGGPRPGRGQSARLDDQRRRRARARRRRRRRARPPAGGGASTTAPRG